MLKRVSVIFISVILILTIFSACTSKEKQEAINAYNAAIATLEEKNTELDNAISSAEELINKAEPAYDENAISQLETAVSDAKTVRVDAPSKMPSKVEEINDLVNNSLSNVDYNVTLESLSQTKKAYEDSVKQLKQITCPDETFVIERLREVDGITGVSAATEDNDPNGQLGKQGGYTAQVYFSYNLINQSEIDGNSIIEKGTDCGGSIEVYSTVEEANKRNEYLGSYDGTIFSSGSHNVYETLLIRTSDKLKASQQKELEQKIVESLLKIDD